MKKFISIIFTLCLLTTVSVPKVAAIDRNNDSQFMSNIEELNLNEEGVISAFTCYSEMDNVNYLVKEFADKILVFNNDTDELVMSATISSTYHINPSTIHNNVPLLSSNLELLSADDYERWSSYFLFKTDTLHVDATQAWTMSLVIFLLASWMGGAADLVLGFAENVYNNHYTNLDGKIYMSTNLYCSILAKERYDLYDEDSGAFVGSEYKGPSWWGSPWDYTQPAECRILAEKY